MEKNTNSNADIKSAVTDTLQLIADLSVSTVKSSLETFTGGLGQMNKVSSALGLGNLSIPFVNKSKSNCCAPEEECPPHCILQISRSAAAGERIKVPFIVKNSCSSAKVYRIGVRDLKNIDGTLAPAQPQLDKNQLSLDPSGSEMVMMTIDLQNFTNGNSYTAEIVVREKEINQNICFTLIVANSSNVPVAEPRDEKKYNLHWQSWKSHFYCEPAKQRLTATGLNKG